jgi:hypothetical protein
MEIRPVGAEMFHAGTQTDVTKLTVAFRNSAKVAKKGLLMMLRKPGLMVQYRCKSLSQTTQTR